ncbi:MAG TPA: hypothetical protein VLB44_07510 [Kofleriaceae bacterium]|nr:hypothetical protein [Kofleriaceae bacterium]
MPRLPSAYQLVTIDRDIFSSTPPNGLKTIEAIETLDSLDACEARKTQLDAREELTFEQRAMQRRRAMDQRIAVVKRECDEARAQGNPDDPSCFCEVVQVPAPTFIPTPRSCRASR